MHVDQGNIILNLSSDRFNKESQELQVVKTPETFTDRELTRAIRDAIIAEEGAIKQYETLVDATTDGKVKEVLQDIANEERTHVGELQALLAMLLPDEESLLEEGKKEVDELDESENKDAEDLEEQENEDEPNKQD